MFGYFVLGLYRFFKIGKDPKGYLRGNLNDTITNRRTFFKEYITYVKKYNIYFLGWEIGFCILFYFYFLNIYIRYNFEVYFYRFNF
jgi:hypothetical protein